MHPQDALRPGANSDADYVHPASAFARGVREAITDASAFELRYAALPSHDLLSIATVQGGIARIHALRAARRRRPDLLDDLQSRQSVLMAAAGLSENQRRSADSLLLAVDAIHPRRSALGHGLTVDRVLDELVAWRGEWEPTQEYFAEWALGATARRLRQVLHGQLTWNEALDRAAERRRQHRP